jgi:hypothetical protein
MRCHRTDRIPGCEHRRGDASEADQARPQRLRPGGSDAACRLLDLRSTLSPRPQQVLPVGSDDPRHCRSRADVTMRREQRPLRHAVMIGPTPLRPQRFPLLLALGALTIAGCGGGGGGIRDATPTLVAASFVGGSGTPAAGDTLRLLFSETIVLGTGSVLSDADFVLSDNATVGAITTSPTLLASNTVVVTLGAGVTFTPGTTTLALAAAQDAIRDESNQLAAPSTPVTITSSDGTAPTITNLTVAGVDDLLNGTGPAGGSLQLPPNGWTIDLTYVDSGTIDTARTRITTNVTVGTASGPQPAGTDLVPFLTTVAATTTAASYRVPTTTTFPSGPVVLSGLVVDASGLGSAPSTFAGSVRPFATNLRPFETGSNPAQVWFLDFSRDVESFTTATPLNEDTPVQVATGANGQSDFDDLLQIIGLTSTTPIVNTQGTANSNEVVVTRFKTTLLGELAALYSGANIQFTLTRPSGSFGTSSSVDYASLGYSQISIAGSASSAGVLGVAIFDSNNATQNDNTRADFQGSRLGVFLHTIINAGFRPPSSSQFRLTFAPFAPSLGGTPIGNDTQDDERLNGTVTDGRGDDIFTAIDDLARFCAVITAHECGHSMGLVQDGAMPLGLYGDDPNFPGSSPGHIRTGALFPAGASNVMSPTLSYAIALNPSTAFNSLNLAYLREQVFYGN